MYKTAGDERVRSSHKALDGVIRKVTDKFWDTHMPPNGWGCRCTVVSLPKAKETNLKTIDVPVIPKQFRFNPGKSEMLFPKDHAYYKKCPKTKYTNTQTELFDDKLYVNNYKTWNKLENKNNILKTDEYNITGFDFKSGGFVAIEKNNDIKQIEIATAKILKQNGNSVIFRTKKHARDVHIDILFNNELTELKAFDPKAKKTLNYKTGVINKIRNTNKKGKRLKLKTNVIIHFNIINKLNSKQIIEAIKYAERFNYFSNINNVYLLINNTIIVINTKKLDIDKINKKIMELLIQ